MLTAAADSVAAPARFDLQARIERLRAGQTDEALFLVPGLEGDLAELAPLAAALDGPQSVFAVAPQAMDAPSVEAIAAVLLEAVRSVQPAGPYRIGGYSFGALIALEMAQQLRAAGEKIDALILIEAVFDERFWRRGIWLRAVARRSGRHLRRIMTMPPRAALRELGLRGNRLRQRFARRGHDSPDGLRTAAPNADPLRAQALRALGQYRPRHYDGTLMLINCSVDRHFGCDTPSLWEGLAARVEICRADGDHLSILRDPGSTAAVAGLIDHRLKLLRHDWTGLRPQLGFARPMIVSTMRWFSTARLGHALTEAGYGLSACRPEGHALEHVEGLEHDCRLHHFWPIRSLKKAIRYAQPDILLADDERALLLLRRLHNAVNASDPEIAALVERSLGAAENWPILASRTAMAEVARELDISSPKTVVIDSEQRLVAWAGKHGAPIVLKTDGSWGGQGVSILRDSADAVSAWRRMRKPPALWRGVKRLLVDCDGNALREWLSRTRRTVNAQVHVEGREAIATVACHEGTIRSLICLEVMQAAEARGPATVVRMIEHAEMQDAARKIVKHFGLSGFCGLDFLITPSNEAQLIEINPRVTPTCHLLVEATHGDGATIALFPQELMRDTGASISGMLDVPVRAPALIQRARKMMVRRHHPMSRFMREMGRRLRP